MVGEQHHLIFECHLGPLEQIHLVGKHSTGNTNETVGILQTQTVETVTEDILHLTGETRVGISDILFQNVDHTQVLYLISTAGLEERVELTIAALQILCSVEGVGDTLLQHLCIFLLILLTSISETSSGLQACIIEQFQPTLDISLQPLTLFLETLVAEEHILSGLTSGIHIICVGHESTNCIETTKSGKQL